jgi:hypothetical protein
VSPSLRYRHAQLAGSLACTEALPGGRAAVSRTGRGVSGQAGTVDVIGVYPPTVTPGRSAW